MMGFIDIIHSVLVFISHVQCTVWFLSHVQCTVWFNVWQTHLDAKHHPWQTVTDKCTVHLSISLKVSSVILTVVSGKSIHISQLWFDWYMYKRYLIATIQPKYIKRFNGLYDCPPTFQLSTFLLIYRHWAGHG